MIVQELITELQKMPAEADVLIHSELDPCDLCSHATREKCSLAGAYDFEFIGIKQKDGCVYIEGH